MGLDMWLYAVDPRFVHEDKERANRRLRNELAYWRKHYSLHSWMENLYRKRGGAGEFNLIPLFLSKDDLDRLEQDIIDDRFRYPEGFLYREEAKHYDLQAIKSAKEHLAIGDSVYYNSWW